MIKKTGTVMMVLLISIAGFAQQKKHLSFDEMVSWDNMKAKAISSNGSFVLYETAPLKGDSRVVLYNTKEETSDTLAMATAAKFSPSETFVIAKLKHPYDSIRQKKIEKVPAKKMPKDSVLVHDLRTGDVVYTFPKVKSYAVPSKEGSYAAILLEKGALKVKPAKKDTTENVTVVADSSLVVAADTTVVKKEKKKKEPKMLGNTLLIYDGATTDTTVYKSVTEYVFSRNGATLAFIQAYEDSVKQYEVFTFDTQNGEAKSVFKAEGLAQKLSVSEDGKQIAMLFSADTTDAKCYTLYYSEEGEVATVLVDSLTEGMPSDWTVSKNKSLTFSEDGTRLFMGTTKIPREEPKDTIPADEVPHLDVWSWTDLRLQSQQKLEAKKDAAKTYLAVYDFDKKQFTQLADENHDKAGMAAKGAGEYTLLLDGSPYLRMSNWTGRWSYDIDIKHIASGEKTPVAKDVMSANFSPEGNYVYWFNDVDTSYYSYSIKQKKTIRLNATIPYPIYDELNDRPMIPHGYGIAGWSQDDEAVYIYDRYDIWRVDPKGKKESVCVTNGFGRENGVKLRYITLDRDLTYLPEEILLHGSDISNNDSYYLMANMTEVASPNTLYKGACALGSVIKAQNNDQVLWSRQTVSEYPNIRLSGLDFKNEQVVSDMNTQQEDYNWTTVEPVSWTSFRGEELKGLLYKPENFDPNKKYPVMFYFYERNFDTQHRYFTPSPSRSIINRTFYASNEYIVFVPDITYINGYPGQSSYDAIVSAAHSLTERFDWIDADKLAMSGQSWGGYQTAYLITQTDIFAAAMAGAPVSNMTSAYGGIRWSSGHNRMFQYEKTQSRIGGTLWEKPMQYVENSPLFYAPKVNTPLLMMHNDKDGAVPWYQGIEYYMALRRLEKPVWMLTYNNEPHNLKAESLANRIDLSKRMKQYFDHYLKGTPAPAWMTEGVPALDKGKELGY